MSVSLEELLKLVTGMVICQGLTEDAVVLATSQGCPRQMIRFSPKHYAFQAHLEFDPEAVNLLIAADGEVVLEEQSQNLTFVQNLKPFVLTIIEK